MTEDDELRREILNAYIDARARPDRWPDPFAAVERCIAASVVLKLPSQKIRALAHLADIESMFKASSARLNRLPAPNIERTVLPRGDLPSRAERLKAAAYRQIHDTRVRIHQVS